MSRVDVGVIIAFSFKRNNNNDNNTFFLLCCFPLEPKMVATSICYYLLNYYSLKENLVSLILSDFSIVV